MLDSFRNLATHMIVKVFLVLIAFSFILWGVGDIFRGHTNTDVAKIGKYSITRVEFEQELRREIGKMQYRFGTELTAEQIKALKLEQTTLNRMINRKLVEVATQKMGLRVGIPAILSNIQTDSSFQDKDGNFDKKLFAILLQNNGLDEGAYIELLKRDITSNFLMGTLSAVKITPAELTNRMYRYEKQKRLVEGVRIPFNPAISTAPFKEEDLQSFYEAHKTEFVTPELRSITYVSLTINDLLEGITTSENEALAEYNENITNYETPETRTIDNLLFVSEELANDAWEKLQKSKNFIATAEKITNLDEKDRTLGSINKTDLPPEAQNIVFSLEKNAYSKPIQTSLGWHIFRVSAITPATTATFEQAHTDIVTALTRKKAEDSLVNYSKKIEDEFASGATLEEVSTKFSLRMKSIPTITQTGEDATGKTIPDLPPFGNFLSSAFNNEVNNDLSLTLAPDNASYFIVRVDKITSPRTRTLEEARQQVIDAWKLQQTKEATAKLAEDILQQLKRGHNPETVSNLEHLEFLPPRLVERPTNSLFGTSSSEFPTGLLIELFTLKPGYITGLYPTQDGGYIIGILQDIIVADKEHDTIGLEQVKLNLGRRFTSDITEQYMHYLHKNYPVTQNFNITK